MYEINDLTEQEYDLICNIRNYNKAVMKSAQLRSCILDDVKDMLKQYKM